MAKRVLRHMDGNTLRVALTFANPNLQRAIGFAIVAPTARVLGQRLQRDGDHAIKRTVQELMYELR